MSGGNLRLAYIALGTNLPHAGLEGPALLAKAVAALKAAGLPVSRVSSVWRTPPWPPGTQQPDYFNAVAGVDAGGLSPERLFDRLRGIEAGFGRVRRERWGARTLDLDIVSLGDLAGKFGDVEVPHPRMQDRPFVLAPLAEVAPPDWRHPLLGRTVAELLAALVDRGTGERLGPMPPSG